MKHFHSTLSFSPQPHCLPLSLCVCMFLPPSLSVRAPYLCRLVHKQMRKVAAREAVEEQVAGNHARAHDHTRTLKNGRGNVRIIFSSIEKRTIIPHSLLKSKIAKQNETKNFVCASGFVVCHKTNDCHKTATYLCRCSTFETQCGTLTNSHLLQKSDIFILHKPTSIHITNQTKCVPLT